MWGFFGGGVEDGEQPADAALREIIEELDFKPADLRHFDTDVSPAFHEKVLSHAFSCSLTVPADDLVQHEGMDRGLYTLDEVRSMNLYSQKFKKSLPVAPTDYIPNTVAKLMKRLEATPL